jgi:MinD superfamily P-loop ATPase
MDLEKLVINLEKENYVVKYKFTAGNDFEKNIAFLVESLTKPIIILINKYELTSEVENILNKYKIKTIIVENIKNHNNIEVNNIDLFYLNY